MIFYFNKKPWCILTLMTLLFTSAAWSEKDLINIQDKAELPQQLLESSKVSSEEATSEVVKIVEAQLQAYNNHDIDAYCASFHEEIKVYTYPDTLDIEDKQTLCKNYGIFFKYSKPYAAIQNRIVHSNMVIEKEVVVYLKKGKRAINKVVTIYEFKDGLISKMTFIPWVKP